MKGPGSFRLLLALIVVITHITRLAVGYMAVELFLVLSGFWIATMWEERYAHTLHPYRTYLISRLWRIMPVFLVCSAFAWAVVYQVTAPHHAMSWHEAVSSLVLLGYRSLPFQANLPAWSLDIEMQFYLIAPLLIFFLRRSPLGIAAVASVSAAASVLQDHVTAAPFLFFFSIGILAAVKRIRPSRAFAAAPAITALVLTILCMATPWREILLVGAHRGPLADLNPLAQFALVLLIAPWAIYTTGQLHDRRDILLGEMSFIVYLVHYPVLRIIDTSQGAPARRLAGMACALGATFAASWLIWLIVDRPLERQRKAWVQSRKITVDQ